jgi:hypothetical protein
MSNTLIQQYGPLALTAVSCEGIGLRVAKEQAVALADGHY